MKAVVISKTGGPEVLEIKDIKLEDPKSGEVLIKNEAIGLNYIDTYHRSGLYPVELPSNIGMEGAGLIEKVEGKKKVNLKRFMEYYDSGEIDEVELEEMLEDEQHRIRNR